jgi:TPP-dependent 2-oxoacid decarboxylase
VNWADVILAAGPTFPDYPTVGWTGQPSRECIVSVEPRCVRFSGTEYTHVTQGNCLGRRQEGLGQRRHPDSLPLHHPDCTRLGRRTGRRRIG